MKAGEISVSGFHDVDEDYVRGDNDNLVSTTSADLRVEETNEVVAANRS